MIRICSLDRTNDEGIAKALVDLVYTVGGTRERYSIKLGVQDAHMFFEPDWVYTDDEDNTKALVDLFGGTGEPFGPRTSRILENLSLARRFG